MKTGCKSSTQSFRFTFQWKCFQIFFIYLFIGGWNHFSAGHEKYICAYFHLHIITAALFYIWNVTLWHWPSFTYIHQADWWHEGWRECWHNLGKIQNHFNFNRRTRALSRLISKLFAFTFVKQMWLNIETENSKGPHLSKWFICSTTPAEEMETPNPKSVSDLQPPHRQLPHACVTFQEMDGLWVWNLVAGSRGLELYRLIRL